MMHPGIDELNEHLDGELAPDRRADIDRHLQACADCRREREGLGAVAAAAGALPAGVAPSRDLWREVVLQHGRPKAGWRRPAMAAAAAAAIVASMGTYLLMQRHAPPPELTAQVDAERAVVELRAALAARHLDEPTAAAVEKNLQIIDGAILDIRAALRVVPGDSELQRTLAEAYQAKVRLLQQTVYLTQTNERG